MTHAWLAPVATLLLAVAISLMARDAVAQFPSNQPAAFTGSDVPREMPQNMPPSVVTGHFSP
jgi:hypothetical protein